MVLKASEINNYPVTRRGKRGWVNGTFTDRCPQTTSEAEVQLVVWGKQCQLASHSEGLKKSLVLCGFPCHVKPYSSNDSKSA
jgi:hypothetical protein